MTPYQKAIQFCKELNLTRNTYKRTDCPCCRGSNTFSVSNTSGKLAFKCFRASCDVKGLSSVTLSMSDIRDKINIEEDKPLYLKDCIGWETDLLKYPTVVEYLVKNNCMDAYKCYPNRFFYDRIRDRVVFIEFDGVNSFKLATGRSLIGETPKWYKYKALPCVYYTINKIYRCDVEYSTVIVEDSASACSVSRVAHSLALCGTSWNLGGLLKALDGAKDILVSLDADAILKTLKLQRDLQGAGLFRSVKVIRPRDDLKYIVDKTELYNIVYKGEDNGKEGK